MKYHGLKMEEVNDTMRHLWNKTYQGTGVFKVYHLFSASNEEFGFQILMVSKSVQMSKAALQNDRTTIG
jgi:DNA repair protein RAD50